jgi:hypothetical protein
MDRMDRSIEREIFDWKTGDISVPSPVSRIFAY